MYFKDEKRTKKHINIKPSILKLMEECYFENYKFASAFNFDDWLEEIVVRMAVGLGYLGEDTEEVLMEEVLEPQSPLSEFAETDNP